MAERVYVVLAGRDTPLTADLGICTMWTDYVSACSAAGPGEVVWRIAAERVPVELVKLRGMSRWHVPIGEASSGERAWWHLACGRTIDQSDPAVITGRSGVDLCAVCARSIAEV